MKNSELKKQNFWRIVVLYVFLGILFSIAIIIIVGVPKDISLYGKVMHWFCALVLLYVSLRYVYISSPKKIKKIVSKTFEFFNRKVSLNFSPYEPPITFRIWQFIGIYSIIFGFAMFFIIFLANS